MKSAFDQAVELLEPLSRIAHPGYSVSRPLLLWQDKDGKRLPFPPGKPLIILRVTSLTPNLKAMYASCQIAILKEEILINTPKGLLDLAKLRIENAIIDCQRFANQQNP